MGKERPDVLLLHNMIVDTLSYARYNHCVKLVIFCVITVSSWRCSMVAVIAMNEHLYTRACLSTVIKQTSMHTELHWGLDLFVL